MIKKFNVGGMSCSACSSGIERAVKGLKGVNAVSVSLLDKSMTVDFDENLIDETLIRKTVVKLGYLVDDSGKSKGKNHDADVLKKRFFISLAVLLPLVYLCLGGAVGLPVFSDNRINFSLQFALALAILIINKKFYINGVKAIKNGSPNMDTLVSLGSASAFIYSVVMTVLLFIGTATPNHVFFDSSAMVVSLVTLGKWLEEISKKKTGDAIDKLSKLMPRTVTVIVGGREQIISTDEVKVGDEIVVKTGEYIAVDGVVIEGNASVDKSAITGESLPEEILVGSVVTSGSIILSGYVIIRAEKVGENTLFNKVLDAVKSAGASKAPIQKVADKVSGVFVPVVSALALITFVVWIAVTRDWYKSFNFAISVLVISCPCALGLATPVAVMAATGNSARHGVLFKNAESLQNLCKINCALLDKTATLTVGKPKVTDYISLTEKEILPIVSALEKKSSHPLANCIVDYAGESDIVIDEFEYVTGKGIIGSVGEKTYRVGNLALIENGVTIPSEYAPEKFKGKTVIYVTENDKLVCLFALADYLKEDAVDAVTSLIENGIKPVMITGDNQSTAEVIANEVGIKEYRASVLPHEKYAVVEKYKNEGYFVAMVGDGINDSPALKSAHVGVAMGNGSDIAIDSAEVVLVGGNLKSLTDGIKISKKALKIIKENLFWAFFYNMISIPVAAGALSSVGIVLTPIIASACMCLSSLFVVLNALRINGKKTNKNENGKIKTVKIKVENMMCKHCVKTITETLQNTVGVSKIKVDLDSKTATFKAKPNFNITELFSALKQKGFNAEEEK